MYSTKGVTRDKGGSLWDNLFLLVTFTTLVKGFTNPGCMFPSDWSGDWFVQGESEPVTIGGEDLGDKGYCIRNNTYHVIYNRHEECYQCYDFHPRHANILQYRKSPCEALPETQEEFYADEGQYCREKIPKESKLHTLIKLKTFNINCPFEGDFVFTYKEGSKDCNVRKSYLDQCMSGDQVAFRFHACSDSEDSQDTFLATLIMQNVEKPLQSLTCVGNWTSEDGLNSYLVGILDVPYVHKITDKFRCFIYRPSKNGGFRMAQSKDASCHKLKNPKTGYRVMHLKPDNRSYESVVPVDVNRQARATKKNFADMDDEGNIDGSGSGEGGITVDEDYDDLEKEVEEEEEEAGLCAFPVWLTDRSFQTMSFTSLYQFNQTQYTVSNYTCSSCSSAQVAQQISFTKCQEVVDLVDDELLGQMVKMVVKTTAGCVTQYKCLKVHRRHDSVIELQEGTSGTWNNACSRHRMRDDKLSYTTLIAENAETSECVADGVHNVTQLYSKGVTDPCGDQGFQDFTVRCDQSDQIEFRQDCSASAGIKTSEFLCLGGWEEEILYSHLPVVYTPAFFSSYGATAGADNSNGYFSNSNYLRTDSEEYDSADIADENSIEEVPEEPDPDSKVVLGYMIAKRVITQDGSGVPSRVCVIYTRWNDSYSWTVDTNGCVRNIRPGSSGLFRFNSTKIVSCGAYSTLTEASSVTTTFRTLLLIVAFKILV